MHVGPGAFPIIIGGVLILLGLAVTVRSLWLNGERIKLSSLRPLILVLGAVLIFALSVKLLGLLIATLALVLVSAFGAGEFRIREVTVLYLVLAAIAVGVFVYGLGVPFRLWPW